MRYTRQTLSQKVWTRHADGSFTLHAIATMVFDTISYKAVISNGLVLDKNGIKCPSAWAMLLIRSLQSKNTVPTRCVGI